MTLAAKDLQTTQVPVTVTFLRMDHRPAPSRELPADTSLVRLDGCSVPFYRYLYNTVGGDYLWWLRRTISDGALLALLSDPEISVHVLYRHGEPAGFFEIDRRARPVVNLSYFGLLPHMVGQGTGSAFLSAAIQVAWEPGTRAVTVNTCTADHSRALPGYQKAGFQVVRRVAELWEIPTRLGLLVPSHLLS